MVKIDGNANSTIALSLERALNESENPYRELFKNADFHCLSSTSPQFFVATLDKITMTATRGFCGNWSFLAYNHL